MPASTILGWDVGGAHLKAVCLDASGKVLAVIQVPCPLWQGMDVLEHAIGQALAELPGQPEYHAITMTGELVDLFKDRREGVEKLLAILAARLSPGKIKVYAGETGFVMPDLAVRCFAQVASANWRAAAEFLAARVPAALFLDVGSTTTDVVPVRQGKVLSRGATDRERLASEELVYTGAVRTPVMAVAGRIPFGGDWIRPMAEHFATMADVYRLTGELPEGADQLPAADQGDKTTEDSARRLARALGCDLSDAPLRTWRRCARFIGEVQLQRIREALERTLSRGILDDGAPVVGAGVGRFLAVHLAQRMNLPYRDFTEFVPSCGADRFWIAGAAPAVAVAGLLRDVLARSVLAPAAS